MHLARRGVVGRCVGSFLSLLTAITFFAISVWVSGDAIAGAAQRLFAVHGGTLLRALTYGVIAIAVLVVCVYGYQFMLLINKIAVTLGSAIMLLGIVAFAGSFDPGYPGYPGTGHYALGSFWPTWILAVLTVMANPISFGAFLGDWSATFPAPTAADHCSPRRSWPSSPPCCRSRSASPPPPSSPTRPTTSTASPPHPRSGTRFR